jgi:hypothetical protein
MAPERPSGVTIISVISAILGALLVLVGLFVAFSAFITGTAGGGPSDLPLGAYLGLIAVVIFVLGGLTLLFSNGIYNLQPWAWALGVVVCGLNVIATLAFLAAGAEPITGLVGTAASALILVYLLLPGTRALFRPGGGGA